MRIFGLTGGPGTGKSTVAAVLRREGVPVLDADQLARRVVAAGSEGLAAVVAAFGKQVLTPDGDLDRAALGRRVFARADELKRLNAITHPRVAALFQKEATAALNQGTALLGYEVPLLFENGLESRMAPIVVVTAPLTTQLQRLMDRTGWTEAHARQRISAQMPLAEKVRRADFVIDNSGDLASTQRDVLSVLARLRALDA